MNINKLTPAKSCKLSESQRVTIFAAFDAAAKVINKKTSYIRRFSEPRKSGLGYRCKFWGVRLKDIDTTKLIAKIQKALPDGYTVEISHGAWTYDIIVRTPKFTAVSEGVEVEPTQISDVESSENHTVHTVVDVEFEAPMCPPMIVTVNCTVVLDPAGNVVSKEATDISFACPAMPQATSDELVGTMNLMSQLLGVKGIQEAIVTAGKEGLAIGVANAQGSFISNSRMSSESSDEDYDEAIRTIDEISDLKAQLRDKSNEVKLLTSTLTLLLEDVKNLDITEDLQDALDCIEWDNFISPELTKNGSSTAINYTVNTGALKRFIACELNHRLREMLTI